MDRGRRCDENGGPALLEPGGAVGAMHRGGPCDGAGQFVGCDPGRPCDVPRRESPAAREEKTDAVREKSEIQSGVETAPLLEAKARYQAASLATTT